MFLHGNTQSNTRCSAFKTKKAAEQFDVFHLINSDNQQADMDTRGWLSLGPCPIGCLETMQRAISGAGKNGSCSRGGEVWVMAQEWHELYLLSYKRQAQKRQQQKPKEQAQMDTDDSKEAWETQSDVFSNICSGIIQMRWELFYRRQKNDNAFTEKKNVIKSSPSIGKK